MTESDMELVKVKAAELAEHFDSVRIFVTKHSGEKEMTSAYTHGVGNIYAQLGQVKDWKVEQDELTRGNARSEE